MGELSDEEFRARYPALWRRQERLRKPAPPKKKVPSRVEKAVATHKKNKQTATRQKFRWIEEEDRYLRNYWGMFTLNRMSEDLSRSSRAIYERALALDLTLERDDMSLHAFARYVGFDREKVLNAAELLGIKLRYGKRVRKWDRSPTRKSAKSAKTSRVFVPAFDQPQLIKFLLENANTRLQVKRGRWGSGRLPRGCLGCETKERPHYAKGRCKRCYDAARR
jgi:hypothetical protein